LTAAATGLGSPLRQKWEASPVVSSSNRGRTLLPSHCSSATGKCAASESDGSSLCRELRSWAGQPRTFRGKPRPIRAQRARRRRAELVLDGLTILHMHKLPRPDLVHVDASAEGRTQPQIGMSENPGVPWGARIVVRRPVGEPAQAAADRPEPKCDAGADWRSQSSASRRVAEGRLWRRARRQGVSAALRRCTDTPMGGGWAGGRRPHLPPGHPT
jgi:hypothetical protein